MPPSKADYTVRLVTDEGEADHSVAVVGDQVVDTAAGEDGDVLVLATGLVVPRSAAEAGLATTDQLNTEASARQTQDALLIPLTQKAAANGVATLNASGLVPAAQVGFQRVQKAGNTARTNTVTLADDPHLLLPVVGAGIYRAILFAIVTGATTADFQAAFSAPPGSSGRQWNLGLSTGATSSTGSVSRATNAIQTGASPGPLGTAGSTETMAELHAFFTAGGDGNLVVQWAAGSLDAVNATTLFAGSELWLWRVG